ncbi:NifB/NifX family molybdenum-iron cluster-binding protein [Oceanirhabdus seepicola]|uniref:NifB/NifX family molybdenum-iron cluster-binding protein n=1 Tax=Oceanirhabdus seepicola TaxID=2828781 RepID=A0A9J6NW31_9CLOT|nr:NifB/NifX family molybdenum-iron cluster-binding protein [Oceanirhabdus seepicola]MCM1988698.1 NifB/NifX family molybdenum-iron cluster-binding protein [Oceanirhabdus seepicola]
MKIALACDGKLVSGHFGHCEGFTVYEVNNNEINNKEFVANPGHKPGFLPEFLKGLNVNVITAGGMGARAQELFTENNIKVVVGAQGDCDEVIKKYLNGELKSTGSICTEHQHEGHCNE